MTADDFKRIALSLPGAEAAQHMGSPDFRVGGRIFATLAHLNLGYGNLMLDPQHQQDFLAEAPDLFLPVKGAWGLKGATHIRLAAANEAVLTGALQAAWKLRLARNKGTPRPKPSSNHG
ncbi:MmcQ/YjbR family DNA-binding protein [Granulicella tundricola]|uniref:YjbR protein n=1 Tax=Granulicella tundricola (strain ATCC BAA-1859 / DSM 23138 / MP5ACTX9) TaxID=1198114 RepID=E8X6C2_GRATM|nr:MmcQ/YjbR family DNA-binding protein [Granulicella tundricola]ADW71006.1 hypothetical protein AciX9_4229 [Granulicella tundricola MP5ACTX9]